MSVHGGGCSRTDLRGFEQLGDQHSGNPGVRLFGRVAEVQELERVGLRKDPAQVEEIRVGDKRLVPLELPVGFHEQGAGPSILRLLLSFERNKPRLREDVWLPDENGTEPIGLSQTFDQLEVGHVAADDAHRKADQLGLGGRFWLLDPSQVRSSGHGPGEPEQGGVPDQVSGQGRRKSRERLQEVELANPVDLVRRHRRLSFQQGRGRVVDAVVKENEIGTVALLELAAERDHFLRADVADLRQVPDLGADTSVVESARDQRRDGLIIPGTETPERRAAEHEDLERPGPLVIALRWRWLPGRPQPVLKNGDGLSQKWALAEVHIRLPAVREALELSIVKWQPGPSIAVC